MVIIVAAKTEICYSSLFFFPLSSNWIVLKDYRDVLFCFMLQSSDSHAIALLTSVRSSAPAAQDVGLL